jgi:3-hydroxyacyl-CoA dehydrogenase
MIHLFFAERAAPKVPGIDAGVAARPLRRVGVIGAGTTGGDIAMACATAGLEVRLTDVSRDRLDQGLVTIRLHYGASVAKGRLTQTAVDDQMARIHTQVGYEGFHSLDVIVEAAAEDLSFKQRLFADLDAVAAPGCLLGTGTSALSVDAIAGATSRPESVAGLHFYPPAHVTRLMEIVRGSATSPATLATAIAFARRLGKIGVVGNGPGLIGHRLMRPCLDESRVLVEEGATPGQVARVLTDFGMARGTFAIGDLTGTDETSPGGTQRDIAGEEIVDRVVYALVNEGARAVEDGIVHRASDIDVLLTHGYGFPVWRGGPMMYADLVGLDHVLDRVREFHGRWGARWTPAPLLERLVAERRTFRDRDRGREA